MSMAVGSLGSSSSSVSLAQMRQELFKKLDADSDGKISQTEFASTQKTQDSAADEALFDQIDTDRDGSISETEQDAFLTTLEESQSAQGNRMPPPPPTEGSSATSATDKVKELLTSLDTDGDGKLTETEFAALQETQDSAADEALFDQIDTDRDGSISQTEQDAFLTTLEESRKNQPPPAPAGQEWQASLLQTLLTDTTQGTQQSGSAMSVYV